MRCVRENEAFTGDTFAERVCVCVWNLLLFRTFPDNKPHGANMGPTLVPSAPDGSHVGPMNLAIWVIMRLLVTLWRTLAKRTHLRCSEVISHAYLSLYTECMCCTHKTATFIIPNIPSDFIINPFVTWWMKNKNDHKCRLVPISHHISLTNTSQDTSPGISRPTQLCD